MKVSVVTANGSEEARESLEFAAYEVWDADYGTLMLKITNLDEPVNIGSDVFEYRKPAKKIGPISMKSDFGWFCGVYKTENDRQTRAFSVHNKADIRDLYKEIPENCYVMLWPVEY